MNFDRHDRSKVGRSEAHGRLALYFSLGCPVHLLRQVPPRCPKMSSQGAPRGPKMSFRRHHRRGGERPLNKENHAVARVGLLSGKNCSVESPDRHRRDTQFAKKTIPKKMMQILIDMTAPRSAGRRPMAVWHYVFRYASDGLHVRLPR